MRVSPLLPAEGKWVCPTGLFVQCSYFLSLADLSGGQLRIPTSPIGMSGSVPASPIGTGAEPFAPIPSSPLGFGIPMPDNPGDWPHTIPTSPIGIPVTLPAQPPAHAEVPVIPPASAAAFPLNRLLPTQAATGDSLSGTQSSAGPRRGRSRVKQADNRPPQLPATTARSHRRSARLPDAGQSPPAMGNTRSSTEITRHGHSSSTFWWLFAPASTQKLTERDTSSATEDVPGADAPDVRMLESTPTVDASVLVGEYDHCLLRMAADVNQFGGERLAYLRGERRAWRDVAAAAQRLQETPSLRDIGMWAMYNEFLYEVGEQWYPD